MNYINKQLGKIHTNVCVVCNEISFAPILKLNEVHLRPTIKIFELDVNLIEKVNAIENITNCFELSGNEVLWLEEQYRIELEKIMSKNINITYAKEYKQLINEIDTMDYKTIRYLGQSLIVEKTGSIDNPKYDNDKSLDNGEMLLFEQEKQTKRNRMNEIETECGLTKEELLALL